MRFATIMRSSARTTAAVAVLLLMAGCPTQPHLGTDVGRAAVVWHNEGRGASAAPSPAVPAETDTEQALLAELRAAEHNGSDDLARAGTLYNLAILRRQQGDAAEAERLYRQALEIRERKEGPNHPDVAVILNNLAALAAAQRHYDAAQPLLERALTIRQTALGNAHVLTVESLNNLALLYAAQGNATAAEPLYRRALSILEQADAPPQGEPHRDVLGRVLDNYAALLHDTGRDTEAEELEARARVTHDASAQPSAPPR
jgi:tetratricopeptide (TPR) repeat protein